MAITKLWNNKTEYQINFKNIEQNYFETTINKKKILLRLLEKRENFQNIIIFEIDKKIYKTKIIEQKKNQIILYIFNFNESFIINLDDKSQLKPATKISISKNKFESDNTNFESYLKSPISGKIIKINVKPNQFVLKNQTLLTIESMKMENEIKSTNNTFVKNILITPQDLVETNQVLMIFGKKGEKSAKSKNQNEKKKIQNR